MVEEVRCSIDVEMYELIVEGKYDEVMEEMDKIFEDNEEVI